MSYCYHCTNNSILRNCQMYLSTKELLELLKISKKTLQKYRQEIDFPEPIKLSARNFRWKLEDVEKYLNNRKSDLYRITPA